MVRSGKLEDIRRLVVNAMGMCDASGLQPVKKILGSALRSLDGLAEDRRVRRRPETGTAQPGVNPRMAIAQLESMIRKERKKTILPEDEGLMNG